MSAAIRQPGFDGAYFALEQIRDHAGKGKRELVRRIRYDVLERLYRYNPPIIDTQQRDAGVRIQCDDQLAKTPVMARVGTLGTGRNDFGLSQAILDAAARVRGCRAFVGLQWQVVELVALENFNMTATAKLLGIERLRIGDRLRCGLDAVAEFYSRQPDEVVNNLS